MRGDGFWADYHGNLYNLTTSHIRYMLDNAEQFGMTHDEMADLYKKNGEKIGMDGRTREALVFEALRRGWVQVRCWGSNWHLSYWAPATELSLLRTIMDKLTLQGVAHELDEVTLRGFAGDPPSLVSGSDYNTMTVAEFIDSSKKQKFSDIMMRKFSI